MFKVVLVTELKLDGPIEVATASVETADELTFHPPEGLPVNTNPVPSEIEVGEADPKTVVVYVYRSQQLFNNT